MRLISEVLGKSNPEIFLAQTQSHVKHQKHMTMRMVWYVFLGMMIPQVVRGTLNSMQRL
jgi:hypothetical protein